MQNSGGDKVPRYPISSVDNALKLLLLFRERRVIRLAEASDSLGVVRSTGHRLLAMLEYRGFVAQDPETKAYTAGPTLVDIGLSVVAHMDIRRQLRPYLEELSRQVGETVQLMVLDGGDILFIDSIESTRALRTSSRIGRRYPAHTTSGGKVLLAELTPERRAELYPSNRIAGLTERSITSRARLERELEAIRDRGYGTNRGESEADIAAVAVAVHDASGRAVAAIAISAPISRLDERDEPRVAKTLAAAAAQGAEGLD